MYKRKGTTSHGSYGGIPDLTNEEQIRSFLKQKRQQEREGFGRENLMEKIRALEQNVGSL